MDMNVTLDQRTDWDKNIETLARTRASCALNLYCGHCTEATCYSCPKNSYYSNCYNQLADCDKLRCDELSSLYYDIKLYSYKERCRDNKFVKIALVGTIALFGCIIASIFNKPKQTYTAHTGYKNDTYIVSTLRRTRGNLRDVNHDAVVNCVDYSIIFKQEWDKQFDAENCEILRCTNPITGFSHLFIRCRKDRYSPWYNIEPQGADDYYMMQDVWINGEVDYVHTFYGETNRWLKTAR